MPRDLSSFRGDEIVIKTIDSPGKYEAMKKGALIATNLTATEKLVFLNLAHNVKTFPVLLEDKIWEIRDTKSSEKLLLLVLATYATKHGACSISLKSLASLCTASTSATRKRMRALMQKGLISVSGNSENEDSSATYILLTRFVLKQVLLS